MPLALLLLSASVLGNSCDAEFRLVPGVGLVAVAEDSDPNGEARLAYIPATVTNVDPSPSGPGLATVVRVDPASTADGRVEVEAMQTDRGFCIPGLEVCYVGILKSGETARLGVSVRVDPDAPNPTPVRLAASGLFRDADPSDDAVTVQIPNTPAALERIAVGPKQATLAAGSERRLQALGYFAVGGPIDVSDRVTWLLEVPSDMVSVGPDGVVMVQEGALPETASIVAQLFGVEDSAPAVVSPDPLGDADLVVTCDDVDRRLPQGGSTLCRATVDLGDLNHYDASEFADWQCSSKAATCSNAPGSKGLVTCQQPGEVVVTATQAPLAASVTLTCTDGVIAEYRISPPFLTALAGTRSHLDLTGLVDDGTKHQGSTLGGLVLDPSIGYAGPPPRAYGPSLFYTPRATGTNTVTDGSGAASAQVASDGAVDSLYVAPGSVIVPVGGYARLEAGALVRGVPGVTLLDLDVTGSSTWASLDESIAVISPRPGPGRTSFFNGHHVIVRGVAVGDTTVEVRFGSRTTSVPVSVVAPGDVAGVSIQPVGAVAPLDLPAGLSISLRTWLLLANGRRQDVSADVLVRSTDPSTAFANLDTVTGLRLGGLSLWADYGGWGTGMLSVGVSEPTLTNLFVFSDSFVRVGTRVRLFVTALFSDGSSYEVSDFATLTSLDPDVLFPGLGREDQGILYARSPGTTQVQVDFFGLQTFALVTVHDGAFSNLDILPAAVRAGEDFFYGVQGTFQDGPFVRTQDLTMDTVVSSANPSKLFLNNAPGDRGVGRAAAAGDVPMSAIWYDETGTARFDTAIIAIEPPL